MKLHLPKTPGRAWCGARIRKEPPCCRYCLRLLGSYRPNLVEYRYRRHFMADTERTLCGFRIAPLNGCERCPIEKRRQTAPSLEELGKITLAEATALSPR